MCYQRLPKEIRVETLQADYPDIPGPPLPPPIVFEALFHPRMHEFVINDYFRRGEDPIDFNFNTFGGFVDEDETDYDTEEDAEFVRQEDEWAAMADLAEDEDIRAREAESDFFMFENFQNLSNSHLVGLEPMIVDNSDLFDDDVDANPLASITPLTPVTSPMSDFTEEYLESTIGTSANNGNNTSNNNYNIQDSYPEGGRSRISESGIERCLSPILETPMEELQEDDKEEDLSDFIRQELRTMFYADDQTNEEVIYTGEDADPENVLVGNSGDKVEENNDDSEKDDKEDTVESLSYAETYQNVIDTQSRLVDAIKEALDSLHQLAQVTQNGIDLLEAENKRDDEVLAAISKY